MYRISNYLHSRMWIIIVWIDIRRCGCHNLTHICFVISRKKCKPIWYFTFYLRIYLHIIYFSVFSKKKNSTFFYFFCIFLLDFIIFFKHPHPFFFICNFVDTVIKFKAVADIWYITIIITHYQIQVWKRIIRFHFQSNIFVIDIIYIFYKLL